MIDEQNPIEVQLAQWAKEIVSALLLVGAVVGALLLSLIWGGVL